MLDIRSNKTFINYALKYIENPLFITVTGSRMYGFANWHSDWDVYSVFVEPSINLFKLNKPNPVFTTPEIELYNKRISVKVEEIEHLINKLINGDVKTLERILSPIVTMETKWYFDLANFANKLITQKVFLSYFSNIDSCIERFKEKGEEKYILYALRYSLTASMLAETKKFVLECKDLDIFYPSTTLYELIDIKVAKNFNNLNDDLIRRVYFEIDYNKKMVNELIHKFPEVPSKEVLNEIDEFLISIRLEHTYSEKSKIKFINY